MNPLLDTVVLTPAGEMYVLRSAIERDRAAWVSARSQLDAAKLAEGVAMEAWTHDRMSRDEYQWYRDRFVDALNREEQEWDHYVGAVTEIAAFAETQAPMVDDPARDHYRDLDREFRAEGR